jgi:hypothetical protein
VLSTGRPGNVLLGWLAGGTTVVRNKKEKKSVNLIAES